MWSARDFSLEREGNHMAAKTTVGVFATRAAAEKAVADLKAAGYRDNQIGLVGKNSDGKAVRADGAGDTHAGEGAAIGAATGAGVAGLVSLGVTFGVIPVIGPILAMGPLAAALVSAAGGAAAAGVAGALIGWGIPEEDAKYYEGEVQAGRYLVTVEGSKADAKGVFTRHGGYDRSSASASGDAGRMVELKEEHLKANKETVRTGDVTVRKEVHTEQKTLNVPVTREEVVIERHAVNKSGGGAIKAEEIRIPTKEERVNVSKEAVVTEEVSVGKRKVQGTETVGGEVKKEELVVETEGKAKVRETSKSDRK
jgi:uncharacterized protein (TIGR02271 family)